MNGVCRKSGISRTLVVQDFKKSIVWHRSSASIQADMLDTLWDTPMMCHVMQSSNRSRLLMVHGQCRVRKMMMEKINAIIDVSRQQPR